MIFKDRVEKRVGLRFWGEEQKVEGFIDRLKRWGEFSKKLLNTYNLLCRSYLIYFLLYTSVDNFFELAKFYIIQ